MPSAASVGAAVIENTVGRGGLPGVGARTSQLVREGSLNRTGPERAERQATKHPDSRPLFAEFKALDFAAGPNPRVPAGLTLSPSRTAVALDTPGVSPPHGRGRRRRRPVPCPAPPPAGTGALRRPPHSQSGPSTPTAEGGHLVVPASQVCVVRWVVLLGSGPFCRITTLPSSPPVLRPSPTR